ncbi:MAG TPA: hypothetical protein VHB68_06405 [Steroidobacteraceae bacterium]|nr:hypothetical protein [Steroidobacteraceae bacterium]
MSHLFTPAPSGRSKCRGCAQPIRKGELRFGETLPNPFAGGEMTLWFHPLCAAYKLPESMLEGLKENAEANVDRATLERAAQRSIEHPRTSRIDGAERAPGGQAMCRSCREPIAKGSWRIRIVYYEEGRFAPGGFIHVGCRKDYFETDDILDPVLQFSPDLGEAERLELTQAFAAS